jgi:hypothetical protein
VLPTAGRWPGGGSRPRSRRDPRDKPFTPVRPSGRDPRATTITVQRPMRGGTGRIETCSQLHAGCCFTQSASPSSGHDHCNIHDRSLCRAPATWRSKTYRKFSPMTAVAVVTVSTAAFATEVSLRP